MMNLLVAAQVPFAIVALWLLTTWISRSSPVPRGRKIALVIAHPDDEAMFFSPTLLSLTRPELGNHVTIICFSTGDADGLGHIRRDELKKSALQLGLKSTEHVVVIDDPDTFPDSMGKEWDPKSLSAVMKEYFAPSNITYDEAERPATLVDMILTFDAHGVSNHPNHRSLFEGAKYFLKDMVRRHPASECPIKLYTLTSTNVLRKYSSILDAATTILGTFGQAQDPAQLPTSLISVSGPAGLRIAQRAMTTAHKSQMKWFRWGWIGISRYMVINDLSLVRVV